MRALVRGASWAMAALLGLTTLNAPGVQPSLEHDPLCIEHSATNLPPHYSGHLPRHSALLARTGIPCPGSPLTTRSSGRLTSLRQVGTIIFDS